MTRSPTNPVLLAGLIVALGSAGPARAQATTARAPRAIDATPLIASIGPPGAAIGETTEWTVSGSGLADVETWMISGEGVRVVESNAISDASARLKVEVDEGADPGYREVRALGPKGISNLGLVRIDRLAQIPEVEPNDAPEQATGLALGSAAWGVLKPQDIDHFRVAGRAGARVTIDLEAQRLGTPVIPVVTLSTASGSALAQARESRGLARDARLSYTFPSDGDYLIQVRDSLYDGGESASYRLRVEDRPFASGLSPLGGPRGSTIEVTASGGSLSEPRTKLLTLPDRPGALVDPGPFDGPGGAVLAPMKLLVGDGPEISESTGGEAVAIAVGATANGRISAPGEVDRYTLAAKKGEPIGVRVKASEMGSWLDSVVTVRDEKGDVLVENDDPPGANVQRGGFNLNQAALPPDSRLTIEPKADGVVTIEVADRYGDGGPAHGYRLEVGPSRPDFAISFLFANAAAQLNGLRQTRRSTLPGSNGTLNLKPGQAIPINFLISAEGATGPIEVRAEGLPPGVTAEAKTVRPVAAPPRGTNFRASINADSIVLKVAPNAGASLGELRLVAVAKPETGPELVRTAPALVAIDTPLGGAAPPRQVLRSLASLPVSILAPAADRDDGEVTLRGIAVPGVLLQGGQIDLSLDLRPRARAAREATIAAEAKGEGLLAEPGKAAPGSTPGDAAGVVRVLASPDAKPGVGTIAVTVNPKGKPPIVRDVAVIVRAPIGVGILQERIVLDKENRAAFRVRVTREAGFEGPVDLEIDAPNGVRVLGRPTVRPEESGVEVLLEATGPVGEASKLRVAGVARMPRGAVRVDSVNRPMIVSPTAEKVE